MEELVTFPDPFHLEARSCVEATAKIINSLGISSPPAVVIIQISLSEVERASFPAQFLIRQVRYEFVTQVYASWLANLATLSDLMSAVEPGILPGVQEIVLSWRKQD